MSDYEHQLRLENQISQLSGKQDRVIDAIQSLKSVAEKAFAPEYTLDELTIPTGIYKEFPSYGYLYNYLFVGDADAGSTLTFGNKIQEHTTSLVGGWNQINLFDSAWWKCSSTINVMLLRSKKDMSLPLGLTSLTPVYTSLASVSATIPTDRTFVTVFNQVATAETANGNTANLPVGSLSELALDFDISVVNGTTPTLNLYLDRLGSDGNWYTIWSSAQITAISTVSTSIGAGTITNSSFGSQVRVRWVIGGTTPSFTFTISLTGK